MRKFSEYIETFPQVKSKKKKKKHKKKGMDRLERQTGNSSYFTYGNPMIPINFPIVNQPAGGPVSGTGPVIS